MFIGDDVAVAAHVDDMLIVAKSKEAIERLKSKMKTVLKIKELGEPNFLLGVRIMRDRTKKTLSICQEAYVAKILERFGMQDCKAQRTPAVTKE